MLDANSSADEKGEQVIPYFVLKLRHGARLAPEDEEILTRLLRQNRTLGPRHDFATQGSEARSIPIIVEGWAYRYRLLENGKRQITALYLPGDLCEPFGVLPRFMDSSVSALTPVVVAHVLPTVINEIARSNPRINEALWWDLLTASSMDQERMVCLGRRSAAERIGHLICELQVRLTMVGLADASGYEMLLPQIEMSDLLGLTAVHVSRSLGALRDLGLVSLHGQRLIIHDVDALRAFALFDPSYLHSEGFQKS